MKFVVDKAVSDQPMSFLTPEAAQAHPLAKQLFTIKGVASLLLLGDFITVNKLPSAKWPEIKQKVTRTLENG